jgi:hypothetical protein
MERVTFIAAAVMLLAPAAGGQVLDDFEDGDVSEYTATGGSNPNADVSPDSAHDGSLGVQFHLTLATFYYRNDVVTAPGNAYRVFVRAFQLGSRFSLGVDAGPGGAISAVFAPNSDQIVIQDNTGWAFEEPLASDSYDIVGGTWYQLELEWAADGDMAARLYNENGLALLADTGFVSVPALGQGGLAFRGFTGTSAHIQADTIHVAQYHVADVNQDGMIGIQDFLLVLAAWGPCLGCVEDIDGDGVVGITDVLALLANWGAG